MSLNKILNAVRGVSDEYAVLYRQVDALSYCRMVTTTYLSLMVRD